MLVSKAKHSFSTRSETANKHPNSSSLKMLVADTRKLKKLAEAGTIGLDYFEYQDMVHAWMFLNLSESKKAKEQIKSIIQSSV